MSAHTSSLINVPTLRETYDTRRHEAAQRKPYGHEISVAILLLGALIASCFDSAVAAASLLVIFSAMTLGLALRSLWLHTAKKVRRRATFAATVYS